MTDMPSRQPRGVDVLRRAARLRWGVDAADVAPKRTCTCSCCSGATPASKPSVHRAGGYRPDATEQAIGKAAAVRIEQHEIAEQNRELGMSIKTIGRTFASVDLAPTLAEWHTRDRENNALSSSIAAVERGAGPDSDERPEVGYLTRGYDDGE